MNVICEIIHVICEIIHVSLCSVTLLWLSVVQVCATYMNRMLTHFAVFAFHKIMSDSAITVASGSFHDNAFCVLQLLHCEMLLGLNLWTDLKNLVL